MRRTRCDNEIIVVQLSVVEMDGIPVEIDRLCVSKQDGRVLLSSNCRAKRVSNIAWVKRSGGHLIQERLEEVIVLPIDQGHSDGGAMKRFDGIEAGKPTANNDDVRPAGLGLCSCHV